MGEELANKGNMIRYLGCDIDEVSAEDIIDGSEISFRLVGMASRERTCPWLTRGSCIPNQARF